MRSRKESLHKEKIHSSVMLYTVDQMINLRYWTHTLKITSTFIRTAPIGRFTSSSTGLVHNPQNMGHTTWWQSNYHGRSLSPSLISSNALHTWLVYCWWPQGSAVLCEQHRRPRSQNAVGHATDTWLELTKTLAIRFYIFYITFMWAPLTPTSFISFKWKQNKQNIFHLWPTTHQSQFHWIQSPPCRHLSCIKICILANLSICFDEHKLNISQLKNKVIQDNFHSWACNHHSVL